MAIGAFEKLAKGIPLGTPTKKKKAVDVFANLGKPKKKRKPREDVLSRIGREMKEEARKKEEEEKARQ